MVQGQLPSEPITDSSPAIEHGLSALGATGA
jgi:hypothetical protein